MKKREKVGESPTFSPGEGADQPLKPRRKTAPRSPAGACRTPVGQMEVLSCPAGLVPGTAAAGTPDWRLRLEPGIWKSALESGEAARGLRKAAPHEPGRQEGPEEDLRLTSRNSI